MPEIMTPRKALQQRVRALLAEADEHGDAVRSLHTQWGECKTGTAYSLRVYQELSHHRQERANCLAEVTARILADGIGVPTLFTDGEGS